MSDIRLDETGDIAITNGRLSLIDTKEELISQKLTITFRTYQGEWFLNINSGMPYLQTILRKGTPKSLVDSIFYKTVTDYTEVSDIVNFESTISSGVYNLLFTAKVFGGELVTVQQSISTE